MLTINFIRHFVEAHAFMAYVFIFLGVVFEGEIVVILAGIFTYLGSLNIITSGVAVVLGGVSKSAIGYAIGYYLQKHHSHRTFLKKIEARMTYFLPRFTERPFWSIFISRFFILGMNWFALIFSGYKKVNIKTYIRAEASSLVVWMTVMFSLGYSFSYAALAVSRDIRKFLGFLLLFFVLFFIIRKFIAFFIEVSGKTNNN
jgi:membrane protein DedA with SNARE-associated domain